MVVKLIPPAADLVLLWVPKSQQAAHRYHKTISEEEIQEVKTEATEEIEIEIEEIEIEQTETMTAA